MYSSELIDIRKKLSDSYYDLAFLLVENNIALELFSKYGIISKYNLLVEANFCINYKDKFRNREIDSFDKVEFVEEFIKSSPIHFEKYAYNIKIALATAIIQEAFENNIDDITISQLLCDDIDFSFLEDNKEATLKLFNNIDFLEGDYLDKIHEARIKLPVHYQNIFYFKQYSDTEAYVECIHWNEKEGYWDNDKSYTRDFENAYDNLELYDCNNVDEAIDAIMDDLVPIDFEEADYLMDPYNDEKAFKQYREFLVNNFSGYWLKRKSEDDLRQSNIDYAEEQLCTGDLLEFFSKIDNKYRSVDIDFLAQCDQERFKIFIDKLAEQKDKIEYLENCLKGKDFVDKQTEKQKQIEYLENRLKSAEDYIKSILDKR